MPSPFTMWKNMSWDIPVISSDYHKNGVIQIFPWVIYSRKINLTLDMSNEISIFLKRSDLPKFLRKNLICLCSKLCINGLQIWYIIIIDVSRKMEATTFLWSLWWVNGFFSLFWLDLAHITKHLFPLEQSHKYRQHWHLNPNLGGVLPSALHPVLSLDPINMNT